MTADALKEGIQPAMPSSSIEELPYTCSLDDKCNRLCMHVEIPTLANPQGWCLNRAFPVL